MTKSGTSKKINNPKRVLLIEDDHGMVHMLEKWLKMASRTMIKAINGTEGLKAAKKENPDLILLDLMLPDIGGTEVAKRLLSDEKTKEIPIIFITAYMGVENDKGKESIEVDGRKFPVFAKPLHRAKLLSEVRRSINRRINNNPNPYIQSSE